MNFKEYEALQEKNSIAERLFRSWEYFGEYLQGFHDKIEYPNMYRDGNQDLYFLLKHDEGASKKLMSMLEEMQGFISSHMKTLDVAWDKCQDALHTLEARKIRDNYEEYEYEEKNKFWNEYFERRARLDADNEDEEEDEPEPLTYEDRLVLDANLRLKSEKEHAYAL